MKLDARGGVMFLASFLHAPSLLQSMGPGGRHIPLPLLTGRARSGEKVKCGNYLKLATVIVLLLYDLHLGQYLLPSKCRTMQDRQTVKRKRENKKIEGCELRGTNIGQKIMLPRISIWKAVELNMREPEHRCHHRRRWKEKRKSE